MLVNHTQLLKQAKERGVAVPAPDFIDLDSARCYIEVAAEFHAPVILSFAQAHQEHLSLGEAALIGKYYAELAKGEVVLHLDHGLDEDFIVKAMDLGFSSVMIDASVEPFAENVSRTKRIVDLAHPRGISVEAEIGHVGSGENYENHDSSDSIYTEVDEAVAFVKATGVDSLAVSIGTAHGVYKGTPKLNFEVLKSLCENVSVPLVLHGGSGSGDDNLRRCAKGGIAKINVFTDFMIGAYNKIEKEKPKDYLALKHVANQGIKEVLRHYYKVFGWEK